MIVRHPVAAALLLAAAVLAPPALAEEAAPAAPAQPDAAAIEARLAALEKKLAAPPPAGPEIKLGAVVQGDGRFYQDTRAAPFTDAFLLRRVRLDTTARLGSAVSGRVQVDLANAAVQTLDAYVDAKLIPGVALRAGKFTPPVGIERLVATPAVLFIEYAQTSNLVPNRDLGLQASGDVTPLLSWAVGVFDGTADAGNNETDTSDDKDVVARVAVRPVDGLTVHLAGSHGARKYVAATGASAATTAPTNTLLPSYKADSQGGTWFSYASFVAAQGQHTRWTAAASYYLGGLGLLGEYVASTQRIVKLDSTNTATVTNVARPTNTAWQVAASWVLTGEKNTEGVVKPAAALDAGGWGAVRVKARYQQAAVDAKVFEGNTFASATSAAKKATGLNAGLDWWPTAHLRFELEWSQTAFDGGAAAGADRKAEQAILSRVQVAF